MARTFNGTSQYLVIASALLSAYPVSFACWYNPVNNTGNQSVLNIGSTTSFSYLVLFPASGILDARVSNTVPTSGTASSVASVATGSWNHCVGVFTSTTSRTVYLNAVSASNTTSVTISPFNRTAIGTNFDNSTTPASFANGTIAVPAIWKVALSQTDVASLYAGASPLKVQPSQLVSYVRMIGASPEPDIMSTTTWLVTG
jgi:hypothetical protein